MALITCPKCGNKLSDQAQKCIYCSFPLRKPATNNLQSDEVSQSQISQDPVEEERRLLTLCAVVLIIALILSFGVGITHHGASKSARTTSSTSSIKTNTCQVCGRSFQAGDSGGNFRNISKTNMCVNCYNNFKWSQAALGH